MQKNLVRTIFSRITLNKVDWICLGVILVGGFFIQTMKLLELSPFGWDQQRDALVMLEMIKNHHLTLIGPLVADPDAFYLGPLWYYLLLPFYWFSHLHPIAGGYFVVTANISTGAIFYLLFRKRLGLIAVFFALILATTTNRTPYNPILLPLLTIVYFWAFANARNGQKAIIVMWSSIAIGLQIHFSIIFFLFITSILTLSDFLRHKKSLKAHLIGIFILGLSFLPLLIFDLRHDFVNLRGFYHYFFEKDRLDYLKKVDILVMFLRTQAVFGTDFIRTQPVLIGAINSLLALCGLIVFKTDRFTKSLLGLLLFISSAIYLVYSGNLSEYYFLIPNTLSLILIGFFVRQIFARLGKRRSYQFLFVLIGVIFSVCMIQFRSRKLAHQPTNHFLLGNKLAVVSHIIEKSTHQEIAVFYKVRPGEQIGFDYIFKYLGTKIVPIRDDIGEYMIMIPSHWADLDPDLVIGDVGIRYPRVKK